MSRRKKPKGERLYFTSLSSVTYVDANDKIEINLSEDKTLETLILILFLTHSSQRKVNLRHENNPKCIFNRIESEWQCCLVCPCVRRAHLLW